MRKPWSLAIWAAVMMAAVLMSIGDLHPRRAASQPASGFFHTQDIWIFFGAGGADDPFEQVLAGAGADGAVELGGGFAFAPLPGATGVARQADGSPMANVTVTAGVLTLGEGMRALAAFSTATVGATGRNIEEGDRVSLSFPESPGVSLDQETVAYAFLQTRMPDDPATEAGLSPLEILARRWRQRALQVLGSPGGGVELVQTPRYAAKQLHASQEARAAVLQPAGGLGFSYDPKPSAGVPGSGGPVQGAAAEALNRLGEAVGWVDRAGAREYNDWLQAICTPECRFFLEGTATWRQEHWEFRSTFSSHFVAGHRTGNTIVGQGTATYGERATNLRSAPCTITPSSFENTFTVTGHYDARNRRLLFTFAGEQPGRELYRYECPPGSPEGRQSDVETPSTAIRRFWGSTDGRVVLDFEVCDAMGGRPYTSTFSAGPSTGDVRVSVTLEGRGQAITGVLGLECTRVGPMLSPR